MNKMSNRFLVATVISAMATTIILSLAYLLICCILDNKESNSITISNNTVYSDEYEETLKYIEVNEDGTFYPVIELTNKSSRLMVVDNVNIIYKDVSGNNLTVPFDSVVCNPVVKGNRGKCYITTLDKNCYTLEDINAKEINLVYDIDIKWIDGNIATINMDSIQLENDLNNCTIHFNNTCEDYKNMYINIYITDNNGDILASNNYYVGECNNGAYSMITSQIYKLSNKLKNTDVHYHGDVIVIR